MSAPDLLDTYVLRRHRRLPSEERPRCRYLGMTTEEVERYTLASVEPVDHQPGRGPVERPAKSSLGQLCDDLAEHIEQYTGLRDRHGAPIEWPKEIPARSAVLRRHFPLRDLSELRAAVSGEIDPEDE